MKKFTVLACLGLLLSGSAKSFAALSISPATLPPGSAGSSYSQTLTASGGSGTGYKFSITSGAASLTALGLTFSSAGAITGTPTIGLATFTVQVTDSANNSASATYSLTVNPYTFKGITSSDGNGPTMLIQALDGNFYGITSFGGGGGANCVSDSDGCGTIFELPPGGKGTVIHSFTGGADGGIPSSIVQGQDGNIYVTTLIGGPNSATSNPNSTALNICTDSNGDTDTVPCCVNGQNNPVTCGAIFEFAPAQASPVTLNPLYTFTGGTDGASPGTLILGSTASDPELIFGTTLACSYCGGNPPVSLGDNAGFQIFGTVFDFVPEGNMAQTPATIVTFPLTQTSKVNFTLAYPNSLIQSGTDTLYGTTEMGGDINVTPKPPTSPPPSPTTPCPANSSASFGCGGVFEVSITEKTIAELCDFGDNICFAPATVADEPATVPAGSSEKARPETIITQSGARFPVNNNQWTFSTVPIALTMDSSGSIYGTTPPGCANGSTYIPNPNCTATDSNTDPAFEISTVFKLTPPVTVSSKPDILYSFTGNNDGGGTEAGLIYAADGNFYGASGVESGSSEVFTLATTGISSSAALSNAFTPTWLIQGADGNLYGTSSTGGSGFGAVFQVRPTTPLPLPVQLSFSDSAITVGSTATLTWKVPNAYSLSSQECYPFVQPNQSGAGTWSAPATSPTGLNSVSDGAYSNSATITPTKTGAFNYAVTCGGVVSGYISLTVNPPPLSFSPTSLAAIAAETPYSETLIPSGGSGTGYQFSITAGSASLTALGLSLSAAGIISGTPTAGVATFTVQLTDSSSDTPASQAYTLTVNQATPSVTTWPAASAITYGQTLASSMLTGGSASVAGSFAWTTSTTAPSAGTASESVTFTPTDNKDYNTVPGSINVTVNKATATVTLGGLTQTYTGSPIAATATTNPSGLSVTFTYGGSSSAPTAAGSYAVVATVSNPNYQGSATGTMAIGKATPTINWPTPAAIVYGTALSGTQLNASAVFNGNTVAGTYAYSPAAGTVPGVGSQTLKVTFTPNDATDYATATGQVTLAVNNPVPQISSTSPFYASAGGAAFTITVSGSNFMPTSTVNWAGSALSTTYVSATQLTAQAPASAIASAGVDAVTVLTPTPGGGTSGTWQFEVEPGGSGTGGAPTIVAVTSSVNPGSSATYTVTLPSGATNVSVSCLNAPSGAGCTYGSGTLTISTSNATPAGTYSVVAVFTYSLPGAGSSAFIFVPLLLLPLVFARRKRAFSRIFILACLGIALLTAAGAGCGGGSGSNPGPSQPSSYQAVSSAVVTLTVQ